MSETAVTPRRGDIWDVDLGNPIGHEAAFTRPTLVVSADRFNAHQLVVICPIGRTSKPYPTRLTIEPGLSGLDVTSYVQVEQVRTVSIERLTRQRGRVNRDQLRDAARILRILLEL